MSDKAPDCAPAIHLAHPELIRKAQEGGTLTAAGVRTATVTVKFRMVNGHPVFTYSGDGGSTGDLHMEPGTDTISIALDSASTAGWGLHSIKFTAIAPPNATVPFTWAKNGNVLSITDVNNLGHGDTAQQFCYQVVVKKGNKKHTAPDPKITNDPPAQPPTK